MKRENDRKIKIVALDLDGTALNNDGKFSKRTISAFKNAMEQGIYVVISTGRSWGALPRCLFDVEGLEFVITSNGARISELPGGKTVYESLIAQDAVEFIVDIIKDEKCYIDIFMDGRAFISKEVYEDLLINGSTIRDVDYVTSTREGVDDIFDFMTKNKARLENISLVFYEKEDHDKVLNKLMERLDITLTSSFKDNIEIGGPSTSKAGALQFLMKRLGLSPKELMACGDSPNDARMIELAEIGVVMGNSTEHMKAKGDYVADTNFNDGVAKAMEEFVLKK